MSGIVGILQLDGAPVDRRLLQRLTDFMTFRGPDAQTVWVSGPAGFGHTLLATTEESKREHQPFTLGDDVWIVADARVDARRDLIARLEEQSQKIPTGTTDVELILRAYFVWGEDCVEHLLGDFAFGIWDGRSKKLFCVRDQMGVKCIYYAHVGSCVVFSNTLDCIRQHPEVSNKLDDLAIADFLLFEMNLNPATTSFSDIRRLAPAHRTVWSKDGMRESRYWRMPIEEPVFYKRAADYTDRFNELMREAVGDRLRAPHVGIFMSGGLDSPSLAAVATELSKVISTPIELRAFTMDTKFGPDERYYADLVARHLGIHIEYLDWETDFFRPNWETTPFHTPEPPSTPAGLPIPPLYWDRICPFGRVFLQGEGPDNALSMDWRPYVSYLLRKRRYWRLFVDSCQYLARSRRLPYWGRISNAFRKMGSESNAEPAYPEWLNADLETRSDLREKWHKINRRPSSDHPVRPVNYALLTIPGEIQELFRLYDAGYLKAPVEIRYPYFDLRLLRFFLSVPTIPWCESKYLLRRVMKGRLPEQVLHRPKLGIPVGVMMDQVGRSKTGPLEPAYGFQNYVDIEKLEDSSTDDPWTMGIVLRARLLNHWLQYSYQYGHNTAEEAVTYESSPESAH